jgi:broad specificity phosphatase PhoE
LRRVHFLTHPEVVIDASVTITDWPLSERGLARLRQAFPGPCFQSIGAIHSSTERKAADTARVVAGHLELSHAEHADLGENGRSSTGYLPREESECVADQFFAEPNKSARGWERAIDEQRRIVGAMRHVLQESSVDSTILIVAHGPVGALLMANLLGEAISRQLDQPGNGGGNWFAFDSDGWRIIEGWRSIDP